MRLLLVLFSFLYIASLAVSCPSKCVCDYYALVHTIECSNGDFYALPSGIPEWSTHFLFDGNYLKTLNLNNFGIRQYFEEFRIRYNEIDNIIVKNESYDSTQAKYGCGKTTALFLRLSSVNLRGNRLKTLPKCLLAAWPKLKKLNINENQLSSIRDLNFYSYVSYSNSLKELYLANNRIDRISRADFSYVQSPLRELEIIDLSQNYIGEIQPGSFLFLDELHTIDLSNNYLGLIKEFAFVTKGRKLSSINLSGNKIYMISANSFSGLPKLKEINLSNTGIACLQPRAWSTCQVPLSLWNAESVVQFGTLLGVDEYTVFLYKNFQRDLTNLTRVFVENNPWHCSCEIKELVTSELSAVLSPLPNQLLCENSIIILNYAQSCP